MSPTVGAMLAVPASLTREDVGHDPPKVREGEK
jgi:hypothetical protein